jgi:branched-chain amino acid transport system substrate-binding protein
MASPVVFNQSPLLAWNQEDRMKRLGIVALGVVALGLASAQSNVIKIATQSPLSGGQAALGEQIKLGAQLAVEEAQARFQQLGFRLELVPYDDQANPDTGVANANRIINDPDILGVVGHLNSGVAIPSSEVYARVNLVMVSPANTNPRVTDRRLPNVNRICGRDDVQGPAGAEFAVKDLKAKRIFVIHDKTAYGQGLAENFRKRAQALGAEIPNNAFVGTEEKSNFATLITQIQAFRPDLIYFGGIYDQVGPFAKQLRERGIRVPIMGGDGLDASEYERLAGADAAKDTYFTTVAGPISQFPKAAKFAQDFRAKFGKNAEGFGVYAYDAANVIISAIETAIKQSGGKKPSRQLVAQRVRLVKLSGLTGEIEFDSKGDIKVADYFVIHLDTGKYAEQKLLKKVSVAAPR